MRSGWRIAAPALLLVALAGCNHKQPSAAPPLAAQAPVRPIGQMAEMIPPMPPLPPYVDDQPIMLNTSVPPDAPAITAAPPPRHTRRHAKPADSTQQESAKTAPPPSPPANTEVASSQPSENSPIGQLSTANSDTTTADRQTMTDQINATENGLNHIHRSLSSEEQKTVALARTFVTKAREALKTDDLDGAKNYSTKAKLLLEELTKQ
jgi:hypothetical protein